MSSNHLIIHTFKHTYKNKIKTYLFIDQNIDKFILKSMREIEHLSIEQLCNHKRTSIE